MSSNSSGEPAQAELKRLYHQQVREAWSPRDLQELEALLLQPSFNRFLNWVGALEAVVLRDICDARSWDHYNFLRGQLDAAKRLGPERIRIEIERMKEAWKEKKDVE